MGACRATGAAAAVDAGGISKARFLAVRTTAAAVIGIVVRMTGEIARRSADMPVGRTAGATGIIDTSRTTIVRRLATGAAVATTTRIGIGETLIVIGSRSDPAGMQSGIAGHLTLTVDACCVTPDRSVAGQTTRAAMFLVIVRIAINRFSTCAFVETGLAQNIAASVDADRAARPDRIRTVGAGGTAVIGIRVAVTGEIILAEMLSRGTGRPTLAVATGCAAADRFRTVRAVQSALIRIAITVAGETTRMTGILA